MCESQTCVIHTLGKLYSFEYQAKTKFNTYSFLDFFTKLVELNDTESSDNIPDTRLNKKSVLMNCHCNYAPF